MSEEENLGNLFKEATDKAKLAILISEARTPSAFIHGYASLLARINPDDPSSFPENYNEIVERINSANE